MKLFYSVENTSLKEPVVTSGMFDGVHTGHQILLSRTIIRAKEMERPSVIVTYKPHPRIVLQKEPGIELLTSYDERIRRFEESGIDAVIVLEFTKEFAKQSATEFLNHYLIHKLNMAHFIIGYDHRFGKDREKGFESYKTICETHGVGIEKVQAHFEENKVVSSSLIRDHLREGEIKHANRMLGYEYMLSGTVVKGVQIGRKLGYPTANIQLDDPLKLIPAQGVYSCWTELEGLKYPAMLNIGYRPTLNKNKEDVTIEANILNFDKDIYGAKIRLHLVGHLRHEMAFENLNALIRQLHEDEKKALVQLSK
ncbi:bifunctional riboflavin kinase/FAD synthetase [Saccharicrinis sp. FJH62]|uniref:bifunctional riboflavin kinase/FAD synthetase n=1 Tax=Saccharicrinis sp. FJH62 TaxID=3344657 RepID=UPI0035D45DFC